ncbi:hypothetical protein L6164_030549 [Bauhinia variegata]|nr:hypothetical protein L6164_030549 [Bauhinia variegata]
MRLVPVDDIVYGDEYGKPITGDEGEDRELEETEQVTVREEHGDEENVALASEAAASLEDESEHEPCGSLRKCFAYADEMGQDSVPLCNKGNGIGLDNGFLGHPGSAPIRPMAAIM